MKHLHYVNYISLFLDLHDTPKGRCTFSHTHEQIVIKCFTVQFPVPLYQIFVEFIVEFKIVCFSAKLHLHLMGRFFKLSARFP